MMAGADHLVICFSQPSLSARDEARFRTALDLAARKTFGPAISVVRLEGAGTDLVAAMRDARDTGAQHLRIMPVGFPMAANIRAWLPGAIAHFAATEGGDMRIDLADLCNVEDAAQALVALSINADAQDLQAVRPSLGKPGWQFLPDFDTHILVCTGPRCAFRGAGTLHAQLKARIAKAGLSDRCMTTTTGCLFPCNQGPVLVLYPQGAWYHVPDQDALDRIVCDVIAQGGDAPDLRLSERPGSRRDMSPTKIERIK
ncbi:ferredoxin [Roseinatronobacter sp. S2]|uniref:(2Fe-2S) ferredoxin domain-containing protein n=1 Tax=Roseinatronobacter sp. S2 TaxID=3035471 RepID=UPI00240F5D30|nr:(2Fe-2S) ferredoxin domain-containing protein [Roseinatronobacter sp. S2]WFE77052.1 (2Fe-2S) ferredoxin domain-containing protein [Roseinatronobacter sp. S2]